MFQSQSGISRGSTDWSTRPSHVFQDTSESPGHAYVSVTTWAYSLISSSKPISNSGSAQARTLELSKLLPTYIFAASAGGDSEVHRSAVGAHEVTSVCHP